MTDFVGLRRNLLAEKERIELLENSLNQKLSSTKSELQNALDFLAKTETSFQEMENKLNERKRDEVQLKSEKEELLGNIDSLKENIQRIQGSVKDEQDKTQKLEAELADLGRELQTAMHDLSTNESSLAEMKTNFKTKNQEKEDTRTRMDARIADSQKVIDELQAKEDQEVQISPILDFLLKEVRIDIPEVEILSTLAYRKQAMGIDELKKAVSKTPPVIILKVLRNLDSKGIIKYNEGLDTIEIIAPLV
ncbi:MAG: hypothetical protein ACTSO7_10595 [Candidatus Heimdallarchaeota archaeon]